MLQISEVLEIPKIDEFNFRYTNLNEFWQLCYSEANSLELCNCKYFCGRMQILFKKFSFEKHITSIRALILIKIFLILKKWQRNELEEKY